MDATNLCSMDFIFCHYKACKMAHCFAWKIPSSDRCMRLVRLASISHFRMEKFDSTDVVLGKTVANPPQNDRKWSNRDGRTSHASSNIVLWSCLSMVARKTGSSLQSLIRSRCSASTRSIFSTGQCKDRWLRYGSSTSRMKNPWQSLASWWGRTGGTSRSEGPFRPSRCALTPDRLATTPIAYFAIWRTTSLRSIVDNRS